VVGPETLNALSPIFVLVRGMTKSVVAAGADLTGGHSCSGRRGPWEVGPWRPPDIGGPGRLNFGLQLQSPDCNLNL